MHDNEYTMYLLSVTTFLRIFTRILHNTVGSENDMAPIRWQTIILTNAGLLLIRTLGTDFRQTLSKIHTNSLKKNATEYIVWKMAAISFRPQCVNIYTLVKEAQGKP